MQQKNVIATGVRHLLAESSLRLSQVKTLAVCVLGLIAGRELSLASIGAFIPGKVVPKHKKKRVDRWCGNTLVNVKPVTRAMLIALSKRQGSLLVSVDWTQVDNYQVLVFAVTTPHGRSVPVYWEVIDTDEDRMKAVEVAAVERFYDLVPSGVRITILADRGFDEVVFISAVAARFDYVIRLARSNQMASSECVTFRTLQDNLTSRNEAVDFGTVLFTKRHQFKTRIVGMHDTGQKEPWFLATNLDAKARRIVKYYARRFNIEHAFKDWKDDHHGWKLGAILSKSPERLSRLLIIAAVAYLLLVLVGLVGESRNLHHGLQVNSKTDERENSVWRVGLLLLSIDRPLYLTVPILLTFLDTLALNVAV